MTQTLPNLDLGAEARPFLKWVGGKRQLLAHLRAAAPARYGRYHEPFLGGGALFFELSPERAVLSDGNERLIRTYRGVRGSIERVLDHLAGYRHERAFFEELRTRPIDRYDDPELAAWMIYLNKTGFNGLYRVNSKNVFNVPFGDFAKPNFRDERNLRAVSARLANADLRCDDFAGVLDAAEKGDFVYFDPPYVPLSHSSSFTSYTKDGFGMDEQIRLAEIARTLKRRKVHVLLSNSSAPAVYELYGKDFEILEVSASRSVNARGDGRGKIKELLIRLGPEPRRSPGRPRRSWRLSSSPCYPSRKP